MKICIQLLYTQSWLDLAKISVPNIVSYCKRRNYDWNVQCSIDPYDAFEKIRQIKNQFDSGTADVVMSMDCDAMITNYLKKIEDLIEGDEKLYLSKDYNGINTGVFIIKNSEWSKMFLSSLLEKKGLPNIHCEQDAIVGFINENKDATKEIKILPQNQINSYNYSLYKEIPPQSHDDGDFRLGDFVIHFPGISMNERLKMMKNTPVIL